MTPRPGCGSRRSGHDPGRVAVDLAVMLADGDEAIADLAVLREQPGLFGPSPGEYARARVLVDDGLSLAAAARIVGLEDWLAAAERLETHQSN